jgi:putative DNA primase/helicase
MPQSVEVSTGKGICLMNDITHKFTDAMRERGINLTAPIIPDGKLHRVYIQGDRKGTLNGAYILHIDGKPAGWFQHFKTGITGKWTLTGKREPMAATMQQQIEEARRLREHEQAKAHAKAAEKARHIWQKATPILETSQHTYLVIKHVQAHGTRLLDDTLIIPLFDATGALSTIQRIFRDGSKRLLTGGKAKGCFYTLGEFTTTILIAEGFATAATLQEQTGQHTVMAIDAGNLLPVAQTIRAKHPQAEIIICGDNDESGTGQRAANEAALACGAKVLIPPEPGDWNDYINTGGVIYG